MQASDDQSEAEVSVRLPITLGQFLKAAQLARSGGEAKLLVQRGKVTVNGVVEYRRGRLLKQGDVVEVHQEKVRVGQG